MLNMAVAPTLKKDLVDMKKHPFSISVDGSNYSGLDKTNPITIRIYDTEKGKNVSQFLDTVDSGF